MDTRPEDETTSLGDLALLFLRLGASSFGGPAAHIAIMQDEVVTRRKWLSSERFLDLVSATNLIPGPNSTELAIHIGWQRRRFVGLLVAGAAFIAPAMAITWFLAWTYVRFGNVPSLQWLLIGIKPVIVAVLVQAIVGLTPKAAHNSHLRVLAGVTLILALYGFNEIAILFLAGAVALLFAKVTTPKYADIKAFLPWPLLPTAAMAGVSKAITLPVIFGVFFKIGAVLFGSGYVLLAFLRADLVERLGWLSNAQLIDAVAVGQLTPGPVFSSATFIGYLLAGNQGAWVATAGIFLPAFIFVAISGPLVPRLRASRSAAAFLDGVNVASLALMAAVGVHLGVAAIFDVPTVLLAIVSAVLLLRFRLNSTWIILGGAAAGGCLYGHW